MICVVWFCEMMRVVWIFMTCCLLLFDAGALILLDALCFAVEFKITVDFSHTSSVRCYLIMFGFSDKPLWVSLILFFGF